MATPIIIINSLSVGVYYDLLTGYTGFICINVLEVDTHLYTPTDIAGKKSNFEKLVACRPWPVCDLLSKLMFDHLLITNHIHK